MGDAAALIQRIFRRAKEIGLSSEGLSDLSGLTAERLEEIRAGAPLPALEYEQLCRAVAVDPSAMYHGEDSSPRRSPVRFRAAIGAGQQESNDVRMLALAAEQGRILAHLCGLLNRTVQIAVHRRTLPVRPVNDIWKEGYELGEHARNAIWPGPGPISNLEQALRDLSVHVARVRLSSSAVHAACVWEPEAVPVVLLNEKSSPVKHPGALRATLAHELCHLLHDAGEHELSTRISWGTEGKGNYAEAVEMRARAFAPAFLAPRPQVDSWAGKLSRAVRNDDFRLVKALAQTWGLSFEGAAWHAKNCNLVGPERAEDLARQRKKPRVSYDEFETVQCGVPPAMVNESLPEQPARLWDGWATDTVLLALEEGRITVGRARELLTWG